MEKSKIKADLVWSFLSFAVIALGGILINLIIGKFWGAAKLGVFNQIFSFYFILGHLGCIGIHYSVLKNSSEHHSNSIELKSIFSSAFYLTLIIGLVLLVIGYLSTPLIESVFNSKDLARSWEIALPAFFLYAINKIQMNLLNGLRSMKLMSFLSGLRVIFYVGFLFYFLKSGEQDIVKILVYSELLVFIFSFWYLREYLQIRNLNLSWFKKHIEFSKYTFVTGFIQNIETRVDILMLGVFLDDFSVGIYSFASMLVQGAYQIPVVIRNNINPIITRLYFDNKMDELEAMIKMWVRKLYPVAIGLGIIAIIAYKPFVIYFAKNLDFLLGFGAFAILISGIVVVSGYIPFNMIFVQVGNLKEHFSYYTILLLINVGFNALFIPIWKLEGAAIATAMAYLTSFILLKQRTKKILGIRI